MHVTSHSDAAAFLAATQPALLRDDALNSLILGVVTTIANSGLQRRRFQPLLLTVAADDHPVLAALMNSPHKLLLAGECDAPDSAMLTLLNYVAERMPGLPAVFGQDCLAGPFARLWSERSGNETTHGLSQLLYELGEISVPDDLPVGTLRPANINDRALLAEWMHAFQSEALRQPAADLASARYMIDALIARGELFVWQAEESGSGQALSMAARARPTARGVAINFVYTPPSIRGRGYASACVAHLSRYLLDGGWQFVNLFTDRANPTSNHIYERIGYRPIAIFDEYRLS